MFLLFCFIGTGGCILSMFPRMVIMGIGRLIYGFSGGIFCVMGPRILNETVPAHLMDLGFSSSVNIWINIFAMISMLLGLGQPDKEDFNAL